MRAENKEFIENQIKVADQLSALKTKDAAKFTIIEQKVLHYFQKLKAQGIEDKAIAGKRISVLKLGLVFPFYLIGYLFNILPSGLLKSIVNTKINERQFKSSVRMVLCLFIYPVYVLIISFLFDIVLNNYLLSLVLVAGFMLCYYASFSVFNTFKQQKRSENHSNDFKKLKLLRESLAIILNL